MGSQLVATFAYPCPHCHVELDAPADRWDGWVRCASCGRTFLPPEAERLPPGTGESVVSSSFDGNGQNDGSPDGAAVFEAPGPETGRPVHTSPARLIFTTGFVLCMFLTLVFFLDFQAGKLAIFGTLTIGFFLLLLRTPRKRLPTISPQ